MERIAHSIPAATRGPTASKQAIHGNTIPLLSTASPRRRAVKSNIVVGDVRSPKYETLWLNRFLGVDINSVSSKFKVEDPP